MSNLKFRDMPWSIKLVTGVAWACAWLLFEDDIVEKGGLWHYMPFYKIAEACIWDAAVLSLIVACLYLFGRPARTSG